MLKYGEIKMNNYHLDDFVKLSKLKDVSLVKIIQTYEEEASKYIKANNKIAFVWTQAENEYEQAYIKTMEIYK